MEVHKYASSHWVWFLILIGSIFCLYTEGEWKGVFLNSVLSFHLKKIKGKCKLEVSLLSSENLHLVYLKDAAFYF